MIIVETPIFTKKVTALLNDEEYRLLQEFLVARPQGGSLIPGSGGLRKLRWAVGGKGKRGGLRIIYYWQLEAETILMLFLYPKNAQEDLTPAQLKALKRIIEEVQP